LHYLLSFTNETYGNVTSLDNIKQQFTGAETNINLPGNTAGGSPLSHNGAANPSHDDSIPPSHDSAGDILPPHDGAASPPYNTPVPEDYYTGTHPSPVGRKANAVFVMLGACYKLVFFHPTDCCVARNGDLENAVASIKQMEDRFNKKFNYPYVFLNEQPFSEEFKA
jgi:hypothetical protein